jgi:hypothetical protein
MVSDKREQSNRQNEIMGDELDDCGEAETSGQGEIRVERGWWVPSPRPSPGAAGSLLWSAGGGPWPSSEPPLGERAFFEFSNTE